MKKPFSKLVDYLLIPSAGLITGLSFIKPWPELKKLDFSNLDMQIIEDEGVINDLNKHLATKYKHDNPKSIVISKQSELIPREHALNHVGINLFRHKERFCIDPVFVRHENASDYDNIELSCYFHLGKQLLNPKDNTTYKGALTLVMDEVLCFTGFPKLPHKKGVTASLTLEFLKDEIPVDQLLVLNCKIKEQKGRKCITTCELVPVYDKNTRPPLKSEFWSYFNWLKTGDFEPSDNDILAKGTCVLVEPKWFKYFNWIDIFSGDATR